MVTINPNLVDLDLHCPIGWSNSQTHILHIKLHLHLPTGQLLSYHVIQLDIIYIYIYVTQLRSGEDPELWNTLKNASYRGGRAAKCFKYSPTEGDGGVRAIRSSPG